MDNEAFGRRMKEAFLRGGQDKRLLRLELLAYVTKDRLIGATIRQQLEDKEPKHPKIRMVGHAPCIQCTWLLSELDNQDQVAVGSTLWLCLN